MLSAGLLCTSCQNGYEKEVNESLDRIVESMTTANDKEAWNEYLIMEAAIRQTEKEVLLNEKWTSTKASDLTDEKVQKKSDEFGKLLTAFNTITNAKLEKIKGKLYKEEVPCEFDSKAYTSVKVNFIDPLEDTKHGLCMQVTAKPAIENMENLKFEFLNAEGEVVGEGRCRRSRTIGYRKFKMEDGVLTAYFNVRVRFATVRFLSPEAPCFQFSRRGISDVQVGNSIASVPASIDELYTRFEKKKETFSDMDGEWTETWLEFYNGDTPVLKAWYEGGKVTSVSALEGATNIRTTTGVKAGGPIAQLCELSDITWTNYFNGTICAESHDFYYFISDESLTDAGNQHIETQNPKMKPADFKEGAVINYITTKNN